MIMGLKKFGTAEPIEPEPDDNQKTASANWTEKDEQALAKENEQADSE